MGIKLYVLVFLISVNLVSAVIFSEIFADPIDDESLNEWIEIYNDGDSSIDVYGWIIGDENSNDTIYGGLYGGLGTIIPAYGYGIITDSETRVYDNFDVGSNVIRLYVDDSSIGNGLNNGGEMIYLFDDTVLVDSMGYVAVDEGESYALVDFEWLEMIPTPGYANSESFNECDWVVDNVLEDIEFYSDDFEFKIRAEKNFGEKINISSWIVIQNIYGDVVKEYNPWLDDAVTSKKTSSTYSPNLDPGLYFIFSNIFVTCFDSYFDDNSDFDYFIILDDKPDEDSILDIESIYDLGSDKKAKFGQDIRIRLYVYKGNETKESIAIWIENDREGRVSKETRIKAETKYTENVYTLPIQIKPNCNEGFDDGNYYVMAEGLDVYDSKEIKITGLTNNMCEKITTVTSKKSSGKLEFEVIDFVEKVEIGKKFDVNIVLTNTGDTKYDVRLWSYIYRGSKSYSGDREENKKSFLVNPKSTKYVTLSNMVLGAEEGEYKLKVVMNKDDQKTNHDIVKEIELFKGEHSQVASIEKFVLDQDGELTNVVVDVANNNGKKENLKLSLFSNQNYQVKSFSVLKESNLDVNFPIRLGENNVLLFKLENDEGVVDIKELMIKKTTSGLKAILANKNHDDFFDIKESKQETVYESTDIEARKLVFVFLIVLLLFVSLVFLFRKY